MENYEGIIQAAGLSAQIVNIREIFSSISLDEIVTFWPGSQSERERVKTPKLDPRLRAHALLYPAAVKTKTTISFLSSAYYAPLPLAFFILSCTTLKSDMKPLREHSHAETGQNSNSAFCLMSFFFIPSSSVTALLHRFHQVGGLPKQEKAEQIEQKPHTPYRH